MGLQGSGKTTSTVKLAKYLKLRSKKVLLAPCDLQRLAAVEQLKQLSEQIEVDFFTSEKKTALEVAKDAQEFAKKNLYDVLLIDTAGRLAIDDELMNELKSIKSNLDINESFYVADSLVGTEAINSAKSFNEKIGIDGVILSKYDGDSKGGIALSIAFFLNISLRFIGHGEKAEDLEIFIPKRITSRLMGLGDVEGLVEKASVVIDEKEAKKTTAKIKKGSFSFEDFVKQLESVGKMGSMKSMLSMIPGMNNAKEALKNFDFENSTEIKQIKAIVSSMTLKEKRDVSLLNNSRKRRIAQGAGLSVADVNRCVKQFKTATKMAKKFSKGGSSMNSMLANMNMPR